MARRMPPFASVWAELAFAYERLDRYTDADAAAERAFEIDPMANDAFTARIQSLERQNRIDEAIACAEQFAATRPYEHQGPERLGILLAKIGRVDEALAHSARMEPRLLPRVAQSRPARSAGDYAGALDPRALAAQRGQRARSKATPTTSCYRRPHRRRPPRYAPGRPREREPGVYPLYRERLRVAASARSSRT